MSCCNDCRIDVVDESGEGQGGKNRWHTMYVQKTQLMIVSISTETRKPNTQVFLSLMRIVYWPPTPGRCGASMMPSDKMTSRERGRQSRAKPPVRGRSRAPVQERFFWPPGDSARCSPTAYWPDMRRYPCDRISPHFQNPASISVLSSEVLGCENSIRQNRKPL